MPGGSSRAIFGRNTSARASATLLLASGKLDRPPFPESCQLHHREGGLDAALDFRRGRASHRKGKSDVFRDRHVRKQRVALEHDAEIATVWREVGDRPAVDFDQPRRGSLEARQHHQACGFSGAGRTQQSQELTAFDCEIEIVDRQNTAIIGLGDTLEGGGMGCDWLVAMDRYFRSNRRYG